MFIRTGPSSYATWSSKRFPTGNWTLGVRVAFEHCSLAMLYGPPPHY